MNNKYGFDERLSNKNGFLCALVLDKLANYALILIQSGGDFAMQVLATFKVTVCFFPEISVKLLARWNEWQTLVSA